MLFDRSRRALYTGEDSGQYPVRLVQVDQLTESPVREPTFLVRCIATERMYRARPTDLEPIHK